MTHNCPLEGCEESFATEGGLVQHIAAKRDEKHSDYDHGDKGDIYLLVRDASPQSTEELYSGPDLEKDESDDTPPSSPSSPSFPENPDREEQEIDEEKENSSNYPDCPSCGIPLKSINEIDPRRREHVDSEYYCPECLQEYKET